MFRYHNRHKSKQISQHVLSRPQQEIKVRHENNKLFLDQREIQAPVTDYIMEAVAGKKCKSGHGSDEITSQLRSKTTAAEGVLGWELLTFAGVFLITTIWFEKASGETA